MKEINFGISAGSDFQKDAFDSADFIELKKITAHEVSRVRELTSKPILFHIQYTSENRYLLPSVDDFSHYLDEFRAAYRLAKPEIISFHFGLAARSVLIDKETFMAVADAGLLSREELTKMIEHNIKAIRSAFPSSLLLLENLEFVPESLSKGAYRYIQEADFFSGNVLRWHRNGLIDGIVLDIAHALITSWNHPLYNGLYPNLLKNSGGKGAVKDRILAYQTEKTDSYDRHLEDESYIELLGSEDTSMHIQYFRMYITQLPLELVREVHISGAGRLPSGVFVDTHRELSDTEMEALKVLFTLIDGNESDTLPVTLEYTRSMSSIPLILRKLRDSCTGGFR